MSNQKCSKCKARFYLSHTAFIPNMICGGCRDNIRGGGVFPRPGRKRSRFDDDMEVLL